MKKIVSAAALVILSLCCAIGIGGSASGAIADDADETELAAIINIKTTLSLPIKINPNADTRENIVKCEEVKIANLSRIPVSVSLTNIQDSYGNEYVRYSDNKTGDGSTTIDWESLGSKNTKKYIAFRIFDSDILPGTVLPLGELDGFKENGDNIAPYEISLPISVKTGYAWESDMRRNYALTLSIRANFTFGISAEGIDSFGVLGYPYEQPKTKTVTITNMGNGPVRLEQPTAEFFDIGELSVTYLENCGDTAKFTVMPKSSLEPSAETYSEMITINTNRGASAAIDADVTVHSYSIDLGSIGGTQNLDFGTVLTPYAQPNAKVVTITNTGVGPVTVNELPELPKGFEYVDLSQDWHLPACGDTAEFSIRPKAGLEPRAGSYTGSIAITAVTDIGGEVNVSLTMSFTVKPANVTITLDANGGTVNGKSQVQYSIPKNTSFAQNGLSLPIAERASHGFNLYKHVGWVESPGSNSLVDENYVFTGNKVLYSWLKNEAWVRQTGLTMKPGYDDGNANCALCRDHDGGGPPWHLYIDGVQVKDRLVDGTGPISHQHLKYYLDTDGHDARHWVRLGPDGRASSTGEWYFFRCTSTGTRYYYPDGSYHGDTGSMVVNKWVRWGSYWYWMKGDGKMAHGESIAIGGKTYHFDSSGRCTNP